MNRKGRRASAASAVLGGLAAVAWGLFGTAGAAAASDADGELIVGIPGAGEVLDVDACVRAALAGNADLEDTRLRRRELRGQGWQAIATGVPSLDVSGTWSRSRDPSFLLDESFSDPGDGVEISSFLPSPSELPAQTFWRGSIGSEWEINPFRIANSVGGVKARLEQHDYDVRSAEHLAIEATMSAFFEVARSHERAAALEADLAARRANLDLTRRRYQLDLGTELDTLRAAVSLANLQPELRRARKDVHAGAARLNLLMGRDPRTPLTLVPVLEVETAPVDPAAARTLAASRPDLRAQELEIRFLEKQGGVLRAEQRPALSLDGRYGYVARTAEGLADRDNDFWSANITLRIPLFDGFATKGRVQENDGTIARAERGLVEARRQADLEVTVALEELEAARENLRAAELNLEAADRAHALMRLRFEQGQAEWLEVLNAQSDRLLARSNRIAARFDVLSQTAALKRALGVDPRTPLAELVSAPEGSSE